MRVVRMGFLDRLKALVAGRPPTPQETALIFVRLPEPLQPIERGDRYEDPLDAELQLAELGCVSGGGSQLSDLQPDGSRLIEWCGVDVDATDVPRALQLLRRELPPLGCLAGTVLEYSLNEVELKDEFDGSGWTIGRLRAEAHPGSTT
jgi:hypothetical protein